MGFVEAEVGRVYVSKLAYEADLLGSIQEFVEEREIASGVFYLIGAVKKAKVSFYNHQEKKYSEILLDKPLEILSCVGNVGKMDGKTVLHAHVTLSDSQGNAYGGHLAPGTTVFSAELFLLELKSVVLERTYDQTTGLNLFKLG